MEQPVAGKSLGIAIPESPVREEALCAVCLQWTVDGKDCHQPWCPEGQPKETPTLTRP